MTKSNPPTMEEKIQKMDSIQCLKFLEDVVWKRDAAMLRQKIEAERIAKAQAPPVQTPVKKKIWNWPVIYRYERGGLTIYQQDIKLIEDGFPFTYNGNTYWQSGGNIIKGVVEWDEPRRCVNMELELWSKHRKEYEWNLKSLGKPN